MLNTTCKPCNPKETISAKPKKQEPTETQRHKNKASQTQASNLPYKNGVTDNA
jgi:hypothetical protein